MAHVVVDIEAAGDDGEPMCVVCMEPMEWVAVSPCGHREVCVRCAASIRFFHCDFRCCICRSHCPTVVVTRAFNNRASGGGQGRGFPFLWPAPPADALFASDVLVVVGHNYWYHHGMGAYFDDVHQYQEMKKVCTAWPPPPSSSVEESRAAAGGGATLVNHAGRYPDALVFPRPAATVNNVNLNVSVPPRQAADDAPLEDPASSSDEVRTSLLWIAVLLPLLTTGGFLLVAEHPYPKVLIIALVTVLFSAFIASTVYVWRKFDSNSLQWRWMN